LMRAPSSRRFSPFYGVGIGGNGADEGEIDDGSYQWGQAVADGAGVVDIDEFLAELIMGKPAGFFLGKRFGAVKAARAKNGLKAETAAAQV
jgi:hypothetical protein